MAQRNYSYIWLPALIAIIVVTVGRALTIYPLALIFARTSRRVRMDHQHILFWGGLRGALALALALGLPPEMPQREAIVSVAFAVVGVFDHRAGSDDQTINPSSRRKY